MGRTLGELFSTMSSAEFSFWQALNAEAPLDDTRADVGFAVVAAAVANYAGKVRKGDAGDAKLSEFLPFRKRVDEVEQDPDPLKFFGKL